MKLTYDGELGQAYLHITNRDVKDLQANKILHNGEIFVALDGIDEEAPELCWDKHFPTKLIGVHISNMLLNTFLAISRIPSTAGRSCIERIGSSLSLELLQQSETEDG